MISYETHDELVGNLSVMSFLRHNANDSSLNHRRRSKVREAFAECDGGVILRSLKQTPPLCVCAVLHIWLNPGLYPRLMLYMSLKLLYKVLYA